ncbi:MAG: RsmB/NOP family class I SAM-dependent RNA methyltransferase [Deltaproteobacteria bacterium]|nr:RsmB/NOP family class I SAM-dependent RNA methyltransferase [Deltaproteobacteria bacterium]
MGKRTVDNRASTARGTKLHEKSKQGAFKGRKSTPRGAIGRERELAKKEKAPMWLIVVLDALARQRATKEALDKVLQNLCKRHRIGARERKIAGDAAYALVRNRKAIGDRIAEGINRLGGVSPQTRDQDLAGVLLALAQQGQERPFTPALPFSLEETVAIAFEEQEKLRPKLPKWLEKRMRTLTHGDEDHDEFLEALFTRAPFCVAFDERHVNEAGLIKAFADLGRVAAPSPLVPGALRVDGNCPLTQLPKTLQAHVWPMDDGSRLVAATVDAQEGKNVLDLCAGGGGKSKIMAQTKANLLCCDVDARRLDNARKRLPRGISYVLLDGTNPPFENETFDYILVDAPCTGTGTLRRTPDLLERLDEGGVLKYVDLQRKLLGAAAPLLKKGGRLVYATCSLLPEENIGVTEHAPSILSPLPLKKAWSALPESETRSALVDDDTHQMTLLPHTAGSDGFFIAAFERR